MKTYAAIHVGSRWVASHVWGVMCECESSPARELLCVGCTPAGAETMARQLNELAAIDASGPVDRLDKGEKSDGA